MMFRAWLIFFFASTRQKIVRGLTTHRIRRHSSPARLVEINPAAAGGPTRWKGAGLKRGGARDAFPLPRAMR